MLTQKQASLIAHTLEELRPNDWRAQQVLDTLWDHKDQPHTFTTTIQVAIRAALNPQIKSPTGIYLPGKHWDIPTPPKNAPKPTKCQDHPTYDAHTCSCCWADIKLGDRPEHLLGQRMAPRNQPNPHGAETIKNIIREQRNNPTPTGSI